MNIKDFKPGQEVFALSTTKGRTVNHTIRKYIVKSVGRKYVKVSAEDYPALTIDFMSNNIETDHYLVENRDWGDRMKLFTSFQAANDEIEREALKIWLREAVNFNKIRLYSAEQLRAVRDILEGKGNGKEKKV